MHNGIDSIVKPLGFQIFSCEFIEAMRSDPLMTTVLHMIFSKPLLCVRKARIWSAFAWPSSTNSLECNHTLRKPLKPLEVSYRPSWHHLIWGPVQLLIFVYSRIHKRRNQIDFWAINLLSLVETSSHFSYLCCIISLFVICSTWANVSFRQINPYLLCVIDLFCINSGFICAISVPF